MGSGYGTQPPILFNYAGDLPSLLLLFPTIPDINTRQPTALLFCFDDTFFGCFIQSQPFEPCLLRDSGTHPFHELDCADKLRLDPHGTGPAFIERARTWMFACVFHYQRRNLRRYSGADATLVNEFSVVVGLWGALKVWWILRVKTFVRLASEK